MGLLILAGNTWYVRNADDKTFLTSDELSNFTPLYHLVFVPAIA